MSSSSILGGYIHLWEVNTALSSFIILHRIVNNWSQAASWEERRSNSFVHLVLNVYVTYCADLPRANADFLECFVPWSYINVDIVERAYMHYLVSIKIALHDQSNQNNKKRLQSGTFPKFINCCINVKWSVFSNSEHVRHSWRQLSLRELSRTIHRRRRRIFNRKRPIATMADPRDLLLLFTILYIARLLLQQLQSLYQHLNQKRHICAVL